MDNKTIFMSSVTDPYQPIERKLNLTRSILYHLAKNHKPKLVIQTRSPIVTRDIDLLQYLTNNEAKVQVNVTITTDNDEYRKILEPYCPSISARLKTVEQLNVANIQTCITLTPLFLLENVQNFCKTLMHTGCTNYIVQPFRMHNYAQNKQQFLAQTGEEAPKLMAKWLGISEEEFPQRYSEIYKYYESLLLKTLPNISIGKQGFRPPW